MANDRQKLFPPFALDSVNECLWNGPESIKIRPKAFAVLNYLLDRPGQLVTKEELLGAVWPDTFVTDAVLKVTIRELREVLHDDPKTPRFIETSHRRGYRFIGALDPPTATSSPRRVAYPPSTVVGRENALSRMHRWLDRMLRGQRQIAFVSGEAGIGKTALVDAFVETISSDKNILVGRGQCLEQYGTGEAYLPVLEAVGRLCREEKRIAELLRTHAPMWLLQMPSLLNAADRESLSREVAGATRERMLREMVQALDTLTDDVPLVLILEDLHWSDYSTLDLISYLAAQRQRAQLMMIGTFRPVELILTRHPLKAVKQELLARQQCKELPLGYLSETAVSDYLAVRFLEHRFDKRLATLIHQRTEGNPLFMVNAVDYLVAEKLITNGDGHWELAGDIGNIDVGVPDNVKQIIDRQIDHLGPENRRTLEAASVAGVEFSTLAVVAGLEESRDDVEERCSELARQGQYIRDCGLQEMPNGEVVTRYGFVHALYQNVLYESLASSRRVQLHRRIGIGGEEVYAERANEIAGELAMHFERGRDYQRAAKYLEQAAENAIRRFAYREAVALARHGIDLLTRLPNTSERTTQDLSLHLALGVPLIATEGYASDAVGKVYTRARELYEQKGDTADVSEVLWGLWTFHMLRAELGTAREIAQEFLLLSDRFSYPGLAMRGHWALEITFMHLGEFELSLEHFQQALALYKPEHHREDSFLYALNPGVAMPCFASWALWSLGRPDQSLNRAQESLALARELGEPHGLAHAYLFASTLYQLRREPDPAREHAEEVIRVSREHGLVMYEAMARIIVGWTLAQEQEIRDGLAALEATSTVLVRPHFLALLAETMAKAGQTTRAISAIDEAIALVHQNAEGYYLAELYRLRGELLFAGDPEEAAVSLRQSMEVAESQQAQSWRLRSAMTLVRLYGDGKSRELLSAIYNNFTEGFDTPDLLDAKQLLTQ
jgi:DNA-binding winged helix-turn-helix (wHTH) protein/predicted ATPase